LADGIFSNPNPKNGKILEGLASKDDGILWSFGIGILWPFGIYFPVFGIFYQKNWQPCLKFEPVQLAARWEGGLRLRRWREQRSEGQIRLIQFFCYYLYVRQIRLIQFFVSSVGQIQLIQFLYRLYVVQI
jgi:hypothetical protein